MKVKDLLNKLCGYSTVSAAVINHHGYPIDTIKNPTSLTTKRDPMYDNDTLYSFSIMGDVITLNVEHKACENPDVCKIHITYSWPFGRNGYRSKKTVHCETERQAEHVLRYIDSHKGRGCELDFIMREHA